MIARKISPSAVGFLKLCQKLRAFSLVHSAFLSEITASAAISRRASALPRRQSAPLAPSAREAGNPTQVKLPKSEVHCMKDVNDLMQAILEMDAAQRRESEKARLERSARLAALDEQKQKIIAECDAREKSESDAAARAAEEGNAAALAALETQ